MGTRNLIQGHDLVYAESLPASFKSIVDVASGFVLCLSSYIVTADEEKPFRQRSTGNLYSGIVSRLD